MSCNPDEFNTNGLSPTWTDMIEGTDRACLNGWVANAHFATRLSGQFTGTPDNICA
jgi:hypothetical protein